MRGGHWGKLCPADALADGAISLEGRPPSHPEKRAARFLMPLALADKVHIAEPRIASGSAKLATLIAGMCAGADSIDDIDVRVA